MGIWIKVGAAVVVLVLALSVFVAWRDSRKQQAALQEELDTSQKQLAEATARENSRDETLSTLLAQLRKSKDEVQRPDQVIAALPRVLPLPQPITLGGGPAEQDAAGAAPQPTKEQSPAAHPAIEVTGQAESASSPGSREPVGVTAEFPAADLKPLYDFSVDCKSCQAQLVAAQADLQDEKAKEQVLSTERDNAVKAAKGGSVLQRVLRAAKWFAIGVAAGAIAAKAAH
ncbi:MAG TPA: hypothetical protein VL128_02815 [Candidatus Eisenbacteria bacterium]|nr:hypothetical protein [Candidatus Eisenbacteria bacterium]